VPESVDNAGILVDPLDYDAIANTFLEVTRNPDLGTEYVKRGLARASKLSWVHSAETLTNTLKSILTLGTNLNKR
jgi:glycosyltransferase involved in cell wall biosynthesis